MENRETGLGGQGGEAAFTTTHWSVVIAAAGEPSAAAREALERLCTAYWYPLYAYLRRKGHGPEDAQDLTQGFFAHLLERNTLSKVRKEKGRFRAFLLTALKYFAADEADRARALKRGGRQVFVALDGLEPEARYALEPVSDLTPDRLFDRRWGTVLLDRSVARLRKEYDESGKATEFDRLKDFLVRVTEPGDYDQVAAAMGTNASSLAVSVHRMRQRFREIVRSEVAQTVATPADIDDELRCVFG